MKKFTAKADSMKDESIDIYNKGNIRRISKEEALHIYREWSFNDICLLADRVRRSKDETDTVTYIVDRNINYTNRCVSKCLFCAFHSGNSAQEEYLLSREEICNKIRETIEAGGVQILMQGGLNPDLKIDYFEELFEYIKERFDIHLHALSPPEIKFISEISKLSVEEVLKRLKDAGLDSIPGGGAEILSEKFRTRVSPDKCSSEEWTEVMERAHNIGLKTTATMMFGMGEELSDRIEHLDRIRSLQDKTEGFTAFIPWTFQPGNTQLEAEGTTAHSYLKTLALSRIYLDNIDNIQVSWVTQGAGVAQLGLHCGANDFGSTMMEENVVKSTGVEFRLEEKEIISLIKESGFVPKRRNMEYGVIE